MKTTKLNLNEFQHWLNTSEALYASADGKRLVCTMYGGFKIYDSNNNVIWQGMQPAVAIETFNLYGEQ